MPCNLCTICDTAWNGYSFQPYSFGIGKNIHKEKKKIKHQRKKFFGESPKKKVTKTKRLILFASHGNLDKWALYAWLTALGIGFLGGTGTLHRDLGFCWLSKSMVGCQPSSGKAWAPPPIHPSFISLDCQTDQSAANTSTRIYHPSFMTSICLVPSGCNIYTRSQELGLSSCRDTSQFPFLREITKIISGFHE